MADNFTAYLDTPDGPSRNPYAVIPHESNALPLVPKRLYIGTGGHVTLRGADAAADVVYRNLASGVYLNVRASHVRVTGTTASDIIAEA